MGSPLRRACGKATKADSPREVQRCSMNARRMPNAWPAPRVIDRDRQRRSERWPGGGVQATHSTGIGPRRRADLGPAAGSVGGLYAPVSTPLDQEYARPERRAVPVRMPQGRRRDTGLPFPALFQDDRPLQRASVHLRTIKKYWNESKDPLEAHPNRSGT